MSAARDERAEAVPVRFESVVAARRQAAGTQEHRFGEPHAPSLPPRRDAAPRAGLEASGATFASRRGCDAGFRGYDGWTCRSVATIDRSSTREGAGMPGGVEA